MINPQHLEMMVEDIQADRRNAAKMTALAMASRSSDLTLQEIGYNFIISVGRKMTGLLGGRFGGRRTLMTGLGIATLGLGLRSIKSIFKLSK